ncbi:MAG: two-component system cell cycle response regulator [Myxococcota bacterium]|jgi:two-component system cell cycle response regulator
MPKARILAVDDQRYFRELIEGLLCEEGYEVETVPGAEEALHALERDAFDIVITDLVMPGVDGTELVGLIKERLPEQDIVMVTGVVDVKTAVEAMKQGATDYILKPFDRNALVGSLDKILQRRRLRDEHARLMSENLEYMGVLSLYERASGLHAGLAIEPLCERLIEGLCLETRAEGGVLWLADSLESVTLGLKSARGLIRVEEEAEVVDASELDPTLSPLVERGQSVVLPRPDGTEGSALFVPLRFGSQLIGIARLTDPIEGGTFGDRERASAEKFAGLGTQAAVNALRFRQLECRSLRDPVTGNYTDEFFQDAVRNEMQKAARFGRSFSMIHIDVGSIGTRRAEWSEAGFPSWLALLSEQLGAALRSTDLLASRDVSRYDIMLPETDAVGAAVLKQRIRTLVSENKALVSAAPELVQSLALAVVTYPTDGSQMETLARVLDERLEQDRTSLLRTLNIGGCNFSRAIDRLLEEGGNERSAMSSEATRLLLDEIERRPRDRGLLFVSPGDASLGVVKEGLGRLAALATKTEIVVVGDAREFCSDNSAITCVSTASAGTDRPFALYYGEGPVYALVSAHRAGAEGTRFFHTDDRSLVEHLAFQFQKDLGLPLGAAA